MTARSIGDVVAGRAGRGDSPRTFQPVRRNSRHRGEREERIWKSLGNNREARRFKAAVIQAADHYNVRNKQRGKGNGPLGAIGMEVLRYFFRIVDHRTGRLEPAIASICERIGRSRAAVVDALKRLKAHGFLDWLRRTEPTENVGAGPQVRQIPNAYGFDVAWLPRSAAAFVKKAMGWGMPPPDCETARREQDQAEVEAMLDTLGKEDMARAIIDDPELAEAVARVGRALDERASSKDGQIPGDGD